MPMLIVTGTVAACLVLDLASGSRSKSDLAGVGVLGLAGALLSSALMWGGPATTFQQMVALDDFTLFFNAIVCVTTALTLMLSVGYVRRQGIESGEYYILVLFAAIGMMLMAAALDLLVVFLGLELMSLALYVLAGLFRTRSAGNEAAMKYFLLGAFASSFLLYGIALLYGATGTTNLTRLAQSLSGATPETRLLMLLGLALLLVGFGFKTSAVPFHQWAPDVYEGAPTAVAGLIATGSKAAAFAALLRVLVAMEALRADWGLAVWLIAVATMTVGNVIALAQSNLKRMLAYSSVAHAGYLMTALVAAPGLGTEAILFYLVTYAAVNLGGFGAFAALARGGREPLTLADMAGLSVRRPMVAAALTVFLVSLTGVPISGGFVGKFYLFSAAVTAGYAHLAIVGMLMSVVSAYYYLRVVVAMYMNDPEGEDPWSPIGPGPALALGVSTAVVLVLGVYPGPLMEWARAAARSLAPFV
jgi:NADH-quinone oxidoreductase subunit N